MAGGLRETRRPNPIYASAGARRAKRPCQGDDGRPADKGEAGASSVNSGGDRGDWPSAAVSLAVRLGSPDISVPAPTASSQ